MVVKDDDENMTAVETQPAAAASQPKTVSRQANERLMISHIENMNFKSYAGKITLGPFHKSFTSIVGPNGSGKSNVIDAMLFVFGYRSKKIRSKKVSLLIHNSESHPNCDSCTVVVYFQKIHDLPGDEFEVIPNSQFNISRTARKDGSSDYYMNDKKSTFKEIGSVLRGCGIDLDHNRFLILQGEVEQISMMKPKAESEHDEGMLEYLEDIIGTNRFKEPIEEAYKQVEELNEKRGEKLNRAKAAEKDKNALEEEKNEATEFLTMENKITLKNHVLFNKYIYDCQLIEGQSTEKSAEVKKRLDALQEDLKEYTEQRKEKGKEYKAISKLFDKLVEEQDKKKKLFSEYEKEDLMLREDLKHRKANDKKLQKSLVTEKKKLEELNNVSTKSVEEIEKFTKSIEQLEVQKAEEEKKMEEVMASLKDETQGLKNEKEVKEQELMEIQTSVNKSKSKLDIAKSQLEVYLVEYKKLQEHLQQAQENAVNAKNVREEKEQILVGLREDIPAHHKELKESEQELEIAKKEMEELVEKIKKNRAKVNETSSALQAEQSRGVVAAAIMAEKRSGRINGIYGRLGDLGAIDKKYDVAISTSCGYLDYIVVDTADTATKCIQFLKKGNVGFASFIALDKIQYCKRDASQAIKTPENVKRLYDLVKVNDEKFKIAFYFALKNTLVTDELDQATRIGCPKGGGKRWRVVTLKGQVVETSGTMSGGGDRPVKGRMGCQVVQEVNKKDVELLEKNLEEDINRREVNRARISELEDNISRLKKLIKTTEHQVEKLQMEIQSLSLQEKEQEERAKVLSVDVKKAKPDPKHEAKLQKEIDQLEKAYNKTADTATKLQNEVKRLLDKIMDIGKSKLSSQQTKVDSVNNIIDEVTKNKTKSSVALKTATRNIKKWEEKIESLEKEIKENQEIAKNIEEVEFTRIEENATRVLQECEDGQNEMKKMQSKLQEVKTAFESSDQGEGDLRSKEIDLNYEVQKYETIVKENNNKIKHWKNKLSNLSLHNVRTNSVSSSSSTQEGNTTTATTTTLTPLTPEELQEVDTETISYQITVLTEKRDKMQPNMAAIEAYFKKEEAYLSRVAELEEVTQARDIKRDEHDELRKQRLNEFMDGFAKITNKLKEMYQMITLGGDADLELVDSLDPFSEGIVFSVRPPKKSWKNISNLSGGEKTLSSLALVHLYLKFDVDVLKPAFFLWTVANVRTLLSAVDNFTIICDDPQEKVMIQDVDVKVQVFALHHYKPTPLYVMDEIDAALDFKNVSIVANYIKEQTKDAQFIVISLRNNMFELADRLVGIYKTDNSTKTVTINPALIDRVLKQYCDAPREKDTSQDV